MYIRGCYIIIIYNPHWILYFQIVNEKYVYVGFVIIYIKNTILCVSNNVPTLNVYLYNV